MSISISFAYWLKKLLQSRGWKVSNNVYLKKKWGIDVYDQQGASRVFIPPPHIEPQRTGGSYQDQFDAWLKKLLPQLEKQHKALPIKDIYFQGGGFLKIPDWFRQWCKDRGIQVRVVDPNNPADLKRLEMSE